MMRKDVNYMLVRGGIFMKKLLLALKICLICFILTACGGGGGGSDENILTTNGGDTNPAPGTLDTTFGDGGIVVTNFDNDIDEAYAIAIQSDGKIVVAGCAYNTSNSNKDFALARYNSNGSLDTTFGSGGKVTTNFDSTIGTDIAYAIKIDQNGKIVVVGTRQNNKFAVVRYNTNGSLDTSFGEISGSTRKGYVITDIDSSKNDLAYSVAFDASNRIVVAGYSGNDFCVVLYEEDGDLDTTFGTNGIATYDLGTTSDYGRAIAIQPDGKLLIGGDSNNKFALIRYESNGSNLDNGFGTSGKIITDMKNGGDLGNALLLQPDGKIIQVGTSSNSDTTSYDFALIRYTTSGSIDSSFGVNGKVFTNFIENGRNDYAYATTTDANGRIIVVGYTQKSSKYDFAVSRYDANGNLDTAFGAIKFDLGTNDDRAYAVAIQSDGKIVIAGFTDINNDGKRDFALIRLWP